MVGIGIGIIRDRGIYLTNVPNLGERKNYIAHKIKEGGERTKGVSGGDSDDMGQDIRVEAHGKVIVIAYTPVGLRVRVP